MANTSEKVTSRLRRKKHIRKTVRGTSERPRLCVFRSGLHIYGQLIDDDRGHTLVSASSLQLGLDNGGNREGAKAVGAALAERALAANIDAVVFDRDGFRYHGRIAALADGAREGGLRF
jgi:large subunit ribosomal protein L18